MTLSQPLPIQGKASSLGARLYEALRRPGLRFHETDADVQALYERAAVSFVASLTYAESAGVREALLSSVLLEALKELREACHQRDTAPGLEAADRYTEALFSARSALSQAEASVVLGLK